MHYSAGALERYEVFYFFFDALSERTLPPFSPHGSLCSVRHHLTLHSIAISACSCWLDTLKETVCVCVRASSRRRKVEIMHTHSLFTLLGERLMLHTSTVSVTTYNTLYEVMRLAVVFAVIHKHTCPKRPDITSRFFLPNSFFFF